MRVPKRRRAIWMWLGCLMAVVFWQQISKAPADDPPARLEPLAALRKLNGVIGEWRGVGQPQRGSSRGTWSQSSQFVWDFTQPQPAIRYVVKDGKLVTEARITWNVETQRYLLAVKAPDGSQLDLPGKWVEQKLVFESPAEQMTERVRWTLTPLNEKRALFLHETSPSPGQAFRRVAEVGYTREGTHLAIAGGSGPECIVTGGAGTSAVSFQGQTYYVCCTGCKQAFDENPQAVVTAYQTRLKQRLDGTPAAK